jgi:hypothetical protein
MLKFQGQFQTYNQAVALQEAYNWLPNDKQVGLVASPDPAQPAAFNNPAYQAVQYQVLSGEDLAARINREPVVVMTLVPPLPPQQQAYAQALKAQAASLSYSA